MIKLLVFLVTVCLVSASEFKVKLNVDKKTALAFCDEQYCNSSCYPKGGFCYWGLCFCYNSNELTHNSRNEQDVLHVTSPITVCNQDACDRGCVASGYPNGGVCILWSICVCVNSGGVQYFGNLEGNKLVPDSVNMNNNAISPVEEAVEECGLAACHIRCRIIGAASGRCAENECKCMNLKGLNVINTLKLDSCTPDSCKALCQELNHIDGQCSFDHCQCF